MTDSGRWSGTISTANSGGFAGVRCRVITPALDLRTCTGLRIRVTGDGNRYKFICRDSPEWNGVAWTQCFDTVDGQTQTIDLPFSGFLPTKFARIIPGVN